jgi:MFS family permease
MTNRWLALAIIFVSFIQFTLNWFCIIPGFGGIIADMHLSFAQIGVIVGVFIAGYGIAHIPGGWLSEWVGIRSALLVGIAVQTLGAALTGLASSFEVLLVARLLCGIGGSIYVGCAVGLTAAWFHDRELALANSIVTGVAFTVGAAVGLFAWSGIMAALGWRGGIFIGAAVGLATLVLMLVAFPTPPNSASEVVLGEHLGAASLRRVFGSSLLWLMGLSFLGAYGSYFSAAQLLPHYAQARLNLDLETAEQISVILLISGIPGAFIGGWLADRVFGIVPVFLVSCLLEGAALIAVPYLGLAGLNIAAAVIGGAAIAAFVVFVTIPGQQTDRLHLSDIPTAIGLMLTIVAVGGAIIPPLYSYFTIAWSPEWAWAFEGGICIGLSFVALLVQSSRLVSLPTLAKRES